MGGMSSGTGTSGMASVLIGVGPVFLGVVRRLRDVRIAHVALDPLALARGRLALRDLLFGEAMGHRVAQGCAVLWRHGCSFRPHGGQQAAAWRSVRRAKRCSRGP